MRRSKAWSEGHRLLRDENGSAALEFLVAGLVLLVPLAYLVVALSAVQEGALGVEAAARHAAHAVARTGADRQAAEALPRVIDAVAAEYGLDGDALEVSLACAPAGECPRAGASVIVTVGATVRLPLVPPVLGLDRLTSVPVEAASVQKVSRFWGAP
ncbi:TadE family protein [Microbacterium oryzae]|uniref:TadE family protein n=1 Tax=Microbacterium oryzae TaxID=743009 RepID=UPI0025B204E9|nr:TadE family protein [Microbacterium oryzae]MDN3310657.1 TadE family protein [Microbacterium oryzae]